MVNNTARSTSVVWLKKARKYHRWLMAGVGVQFLFWSITGVYMVSMNIHYIHGESLVKDDDEKLDLGSIEFPMSALVAEYPNARAISLTQRMGAPIYIFTKGANTFSIDAITGAQLPKLNEAAAIAIARYHYAASDEITGSRLIRFSSDMPEELSSRHLPVWQVTFDNVAAPTFYISQQTGEIVTKRHHYWRLFDWMWRFHIMDYDNGENVKNGFLFFVAAIGVIAALLGAALTYFSLRTSVTKGSVEKGFNK